MSKNVNQLVVLSPPLDTINSVFIKMGAYTKKVLHPGICLIVDQNLKLIGTVTDGDIRRAFSKKISFNQPISKIMNSKPVTLSDETPDEMIIPLASQKLLEIKNKNDIIKYLVLLNKEGQVSNVIDLFKLMLKQGTNLQTVTVVGMGFVGLTLAVTLANQGHNVIGVDINTKYVNKINEFKINIQEPGLQNLLKNNIIQGNLKIQTEILNNFSHIYLIAVGTPLKKNNTPNLKPIEDAIKAISLKLKKGDHVMIRSTVPVGTTRQFIIPKLNRKSKLKAGKDFHVSFVPERVIEGNALRELRSLKL